MLLTRHSSSSLLVVALAIVADAEEVLLEASVTARGDVVVKTTQLARLLSTARGAACTRATPARDWRRSRPRGLRRPRRRLATRRWRLLWLTASSGVGGGEARGGMAHLRALFTAEEARVKLTARQWVIATTDVLNEIIIVLIKPIQNIGGEVLGAMSNGGESVSEAGHLVEVVRDAVVVELGLTQFGANSMGTHLRL